VAAVPEGNPMDRIAISSRAAARNFSHVLNSVAYCGHVFLVTRQGRPVAVISPAPANDTAAVGARKEQP